MNVWVFQDPKQVAKKGAELASWYVGYYDPEGKRRCKSCGPGKKGKTAAERLAEKRRAELIERTYKGDPRKTWAEFRKEWEERIGAGMLASTRAQMLDSLDAFEEVIKPKKLDAIKTQTIDEFRTKRAAHPGKKKGSTLSPATVNRDLRNLRAVLRVADEWKYL